MTDPGTPRRMARNAVVRGAGEIVAKSASLVFYVALARELGREGFGTFTLAIALAGTLMLMAGLGTDGLLAREVARRRGEAGRYLADVTAVKAAGAAATLAIVAVVVTVAGYAFEPALAVLLVSAGVAVEVSAATWYAVFQAYERLELVSLSLVLQRVSTAAAGVAVLATGGGLLAASAVFLGGALLGLAMAEVSLRRAVGTAGRRADRARLRPLLVAAAPIGLAGMLLLLLLRLDVLLIAALAGSDGNAEVGVYAAAFRLVEATQFLPWSFAAAALPWLARARGEPGEIQRAAALGLKLMAGLLAPLGLAFVLFAEPIVDVLYGEQFADSVLPLRLLGATTVLFGLQYFAGTVLVARDKAWAMTRILAFAVVQNLACNAVAIPAYGAAGAAAVALSSSLLLALLSLRQVHVHVGATGVLRPFAGPTLAAAAMAGTVLALDAASALEATAGALAYAIVLVGWERARHYDDARVYWEVLPARLRRQRKPR